MNLIQSCSGKTAWVKMSSANSTTRSKCWAGRFLTRAQVVGVHASGEIEIVRSPVASRSRIFGRVCFGTMPLDK